MGQPVGQRPRAISSVRKLGYYLLRGRRIYRRYTVRIVLGVLALALTAAAYVVSFEYAYEPASSLVVGPDIIEGRREFYTASEGNEVFLSDIAGLLSGSLRVSGFFKALIALSGRGTSNLQVEVARDIRIGNQVLVKGQLFDTGLDVPKGAWAPLGIKFVKKRGAFKIGVTCAACHSSVDDKFAVLEGLPNADIAFGMMLAMASNSAAFVALTDRDDYLAIDTAPKRTVASGFRVPLVLPDPDTLEAAVDARLSRWPPGFFDASPDFAANPINIPTVLGGRTMADCRWLSHLLELNGETRDHLRMSQEQYLAVLLQNSAQGRFRFDPQAGRAPSSYVPKPEAFKSALVHRWMDGLLPPVVLGIPRQSAIGRRVYERAGCAQCHGADSADPLIGLRWTAPYLKDGGVAVGPRPAEQLGVPGTLLQGIAPSPSNSLSALVDRKQRNLVTLMNRSHPDLRAVHITGDGHEHWVDEASGFTREEKAHLVEFLLTL